MNKGLMGLRRYQTGGGVGGPEDEWLERLYRQLLARWASDKFGVYPSEGLPTPLELGPIQIPSEGFNESDAIDYLIDLSNYKDSFKEEGLNPGPLAVPPLTTPEEDAAYIRRIEAELADAPEVPPEILENFPSIEELRERAESEDLLTYARDQPVHDLDEAFRSNQVDDLIRGVGGLPPTEGVHFPPHDSRLARWNPLPANFYFGEGWGDKRGVYMDHPIKQGIVDAAQFADNLSWLGFKYTPKWGSIAAPLLAAAASPAALAAEQAFDFAISPGLLDREASEVPGAGRTWRESPHIDPSDEEVASFMQILLGDSPYSQSQLARPSTTSQRAIEELIRRAQAGTPVNRYRR